MVSERYKKSLVTVAMGFRDEEDIKKGGLAIFNKSQKAQMLDYVKSLFGASKSLLVLKVPPKGYRSTHILINGDDELENFANSADEIFGSSNEIWVISSTSKDTWRCRLYISNNINRPDMFEMAYSKDDHVLDHITANQIDVPHVLYFREFGSPEFKESVSNLSGEQKLQSNKIVSDIAKKFASQIADVRKDLEALSLNGISLDVNLNNGVYDFHDFDVAYDDLPRVIEFYSGSYLERKGRQFSWK